jgi:hypothetical protein
MIEYVPGFIWLAAGAVGARMAYSDDPAVRGDAAFLFYCVVIGPLAIIAELIHRRWGK